MNSPFQRSRTTFTVTTLLGNLIVGISARCRWRWNPARTFAWGLRTILPFLGERAGTKVKEFLDSLYFRDLLRRHDLVPDSRFRLRPCAVWQRAISVVLIPILILTTTPTEVEAATYHPVFYYFHGDHLGSSSVLTDRDGERVQHYEYTTYGKEGFKDNSSAFEISHRYTGQVLDDETGLYYYGARYYDPELGRFVQADTIVPSAANPQLLNRYAYCGNNPLKYVDPSGHELITAIIIGVVIGVAIGAGTAAATGGDIAMGALTGAIGGLFGGIGAGLGQSITVAGSATLGELAGSVAGGATGGAMSAAVVGGDVGMGAFTGAIAGGIAFGVGWLNQNVLALSPSVTLANSPRLVGDYLEAPIAGGLAGGTASEINGGSFLEGAGYGAGGALAGVGLARLSIRAYARLKGGSELGPGTLKVWADADADITSGHASLDYSGTDGSRKTFGTYGWHNEEQPAGLRENYDPKWSRASPPAAMRSANLTSDQAKALGYKIREYRILGSRGWSMTSPCSSFVRGAWKTATGENLSAGFPSTPRSLRSSIIKANKGDLWGWK